MVSIGVFGMAIANILSLNTGVSSNGSVCVFQGILLQFFETMELAWVCLIAIHLYITIVFRKKIDRKIEIYFNIAGWSVPILFTILPGTTHSFGRAGVWCWIAGDSAGIIWRFLVFYVPLWCFWLVTCVVFALIGRELVKVGKGFKEEERGEVAKKKERRAFVKLSAYPIAWVIIWIIPTINRITNAYGEQIFSLELLHALMAPSFGVITGIVYGLGPAFRDYKYYWENSAIRKSFSSKSQSVPEGSLPEPGSESSTAEPSVTEPAISEASQTKDV